MSGSAVLHLIQKMDDFKILPEFSSSDGKYGKISRIWSMGIEIIQYNLYHLYHGTITLIKVIKIKVRSASDSKFIYKKLIRQEITKSIV